ncbi:DNA replication terminus site-binding protein [Marinomonas algarum]|uniref:DNA replication terminus site-binding protein n=1 Tax=Marinomonas algarum TaxID=2883105 RepID=A0A9X1LF85_9GAMM|nr:DNA replication terminus site-binding protein [Marinomonas algarum]MCB5162658.1 DNA replication terminus site-binding protein [Marinomonas algarum]
MRFLISEQFEQVQQGISELNDLITLARYKTAIAYPIEPTLKGMEDEVLDTITVSEHVGKSALACAAASYKDLFIEPEFSQKVVRRTVGAVHLSTSDDPSIALVSGLVERINESKDLIRNHLMTRYNTSSDRSKALRLECPRVMTLHLYRHIRCFNDKNVLSARFSWQRKDARYKPDKQKLIANMSKTLARTNAENQALLAGLIKNVSDTPESKLRMRRAVAVQPVANISIGGSMKTVTAPMPLIFVQNEPIIFKSLMDFHAETERKTRSDKSSFTSIGSFGGIAIECCS